MPAEPPSGAHVSYRQQYRRCGKAGCGRCSGAGLGHGPYWYAQWRAEGRNHTRYLGKAAPTETGAVTQPIPENPTPTMSMNQASFRVQTLGGFAVWRWGQEIPVRAWEQRRIGVLFKWLLASPGHRLAREQAMELLWPEAPPANHDANLRVLVHRLRKALADSPETEGAILRLDGEWLVLAPSMAPEQWLDADAFLRAARSAQAGSDLTAYRAALGLYTGDFLPGDPYGEWALALRDTLRQTRVSLLFRLADLSRQAGEIEEAIGSLHVVLADDRCHEEAALALMRLHAATGRVGGALRVYYQLSDALRDELDLATSQETASLAHALRDSLGKVPPVPRATGPSNLPAGLTSFVGRGRELAALRAMLGPGTSNAREEQACRLLTLVGPGGIGKTRLALVLAEDLVELYPDGVWMVDLSALPTGRDGDDQAVAHAARAALRLPEQSACSPTSTLVEGLRERRLLLVLDNCEHVLPACASLVYSVLTACPAIRILATSRETLGVAGERPWSVPTLSQPDTDAPLEQMAAAEAVRLFLARARLRQPSLVLTAENAGALAAICRQLDGLPLALELAAARVGVLSLDGIATRLGESLHLLTGGPRSAPSRQRTLRATLDWSHDLLGEPERRLLRRLAVFAGGFTLEAGQAVCGEEQVMAASILEELTELVQKSLVMADNLSQTPRLSEGRRLLEAILVSRGAISTEARAALLDSACSLAYLQGDFARALALAEEGLDLRRRMGDRRGLAQALNTRGNVAWFMTEYSLAARLYEESLALFRETDDQEGLVNALNNRAMVASVQGQFARAAAVYGECRGILRGLGNTASLAQVLMNLGISLHEQGNYEQADRLYQECLSQCREMGNQQIVLRVMNWLAISALEQGNEAKATRLFEECLGLAEALNDADEVGRTHHYLGVIALAQGEYGRAEDIFLESLALRRQRRQTYGIAANLERLGQLRAAVG